MPNKETTTDEPAWFAAWFDGLFPKKDGPTYAPKYIYLALGWPHDRVYTAIHSGELEALRLGTRYEVPRAALRNWLLSLHMGD